jgi:hypothetical protein
MMIQHPFQWLSTSQQKLAFAALLVLLFLLAVGMNALSRHLKTNVAPRGIVSFELAGELSLAQRMVDSWGRLGQIRAGISLGLDYLFLFAYSSTIALACVWVARSLPQRVVFLALLGVVLAWAQFGAALLDALENYALIRVLLGSLAEFWPLVARWCAIPKFVIVGIGLAYVVIGGLAALMAKVL